MTKTHHYYLPDIYLFYWALNSCDKIDLIDMVDVALVEERTRY